MDGGQLGSEEDKADHEHLLNIRSPGSPASAPYLAPHEEPLNIVSLGGQKPAPGGIKEQHTYEHSYECLYER